ncbi:Pc20g09660 [Penicillium rubens Wisconsin 54-1255]|uniref:Pc20g09660 protein n=1 Tax=Penicillium rubens (strain ATCC 28089 / DSM 1075 / NRRL 1951 / Wisconsin 54-1255) TaxID=500485 RepID=B6HFC4_PENRW|nr:Pc20g09660 [Penicillium rubens Wisconsin 54-1255]
MPSSTPGPFHIVEHKVPCQHIREYPGATLRTQEDVLHLSVKQYIPWDNLNPQPGDVTIVGAHGNAFPKELYDPLWEEIICHAKNYGFRIRAIWIADVAHQGQSAVLNESLLGNDPSWFDHSRDLLNLVNIKRTDMPPPMVGIGHSMGGSQLFVPLMSAGVYILTILLDPVIQRSNTRIQADDIFTHDRLIFPSTQSATHRRDSWPSREAAVETFSRSPIYKTWDRRVLQNWVRYGLRDIPSPHLSGDKLHGTKKPPVSLATSRYQEATSFARPYYDNSTVGENNLANRTFSHPDLDPALVTSFPFYLPGPSQLFEQLPHVRPSILYVFPEKSPMCLPALCKDKLGHTGTGIGGSGGLSAGRVRSTYMEGFGHLVAQEAPTECAKRAARWIGPEIKRWQDENGLATTGWPQKKSSKERAFCPSGIKSRF